MSLWLLAFAVIFTVFVFATTERGQELVKRLGFRDYVKDAAPAEDVRFLLEACDGDRAELERRVAVERDRYPDLTEAEHFRRAIRKVLAERDG